jgi:hypothetical protein
VYTPEGKTKNIQSVKKRTSFILRIVVYEKQINLCNKTKIERVIIKKAGGQTTRFNHKL